VNSQDNPSGPPKADAVRTTKGEGSLVTTDLCFRRQGLLARPMRSIKPRCVEGRLCPPSRDGRNPEVEGHPHPGPSPIEGEGTILYACGLVDNAGYLSSQMVRGASPLARLCPSLQESPRLCERKAVLQFPSFTDYHKAIAGLQHLLSAGEGYPVLAPLDAQ